MDVSTLWHFNIVCFYDIAELTETNMERKLTYLVIFTSWSASTVSVDVCVLVIPGLAIFLLCSLNNSVWLKIPIQPDKVSEFQIH